MQREDLIEKVILSSIPIRQIGENGYPISNASGVLVNYCSQLLFLTVFHAVKDFENWCIEIKSDFKTGTQLLPLGLLGRVLELTINTNLLKDIDLAYKLMPVDFKTYYQIINEGKLYEVERLQLKLIFNNRLSHEKKYGFFGQTEFQKDGRIIQISSKLVLDLCYQESVGSYHIFKLPKKHPGHDYFKGTSGAPIIDDNGNLVSLVCKGNEEEDLIFGINLKKYRSSLDIQCENL